MNNLLMLAAEATAAKPDSMLGWFQTYGTSILMIVALVLVFWFLIIRPQKKQEKETQKMRNSVMVGDTITTIGGIHGVVRQIKEDDDLYIIESSTDKSKIAVKRWALQSKDVSGPESLAAEAAEKAAAPEKKSKKSKGEEKSDKDLNTDKAEEKK